MPAMAALSANARQYCKAQAAAYFVKSDECGAGSVQYKLVQAITQVQSC